MLFVGLYRTVENARACADRGEGVAEIVTEHRDELFAQLRTFMLAPEFSSATLSATFASSRVSFGLQY